MNTVEIEKINNFVDIAPVINKLDIEKIDITTTYYFLQSTQILEHHKEVSDG